MIARRLVIPTAAKGRKVESRDLEKGQRTISYSLFDDGTRPEHNARIVQANAHREAARALPQAQTRRDPHERTADATALNETPAAVSAARDRLPRVPAHDTTPSRDDLPRLKYRDLPDIHDMADVRARPSLPENARAPPYPCPAPCRAIVEDYLALCRDPGRDLVAWANETIEPEAAHNPHATGEQAQQGGLPPPRTPRTVADALVEDYLALCSDPSRDLSGWLNETMDGHGWDNLAAGREQAASPGQPTETAKTLTATAAASAVWARIDDSRTVCRNPPDDPGKDFENRKRQERDHPKATLKPRSDDVRSSFRLRENALCPVQIRLEPCYGRRSRSPDLSSRPEAGLQKHDAVQSLQSGPGRPVGLKAFFPAVPVGSPGRREATDQAREGRGPEQRLDDGEEALRTLQLCFAELSRLVRRQLAHAAKTAPRHQLAVTQRFIIEERERHAAFLIKEFRENRANATKRNREKVRGPREPLRPQATPPPGLIAAQREAQKPGGYVLAGPS